jgi:hypothetical protein
MLPPGSRLSIYDAATNTINDYVPASDGHIRKTANATSDRLPSIVPPSRENPIISGVNVFLVALNAEIKFRRFQLLAGTFNLPADNILLVDRTKFLIDLLYWVLQATKGSRGEEILAAKSRRNAIRDARPKPAPSKESSDDDMSTEEETVPSTLKFRYPVEADLETRKAFGRSLMCGHGKFLQYQSQPYLYSVGIANLLDLEYDPELFENAIPLENSQIHSMYLLSRYLLTSIFI